MWAEQIRNTGMVRWPYGQAARSLIHESDLAAVAVRALTETGHAGARYVLSGPGTVTQTRAGAGDREGDRPAACLRGDLPRGRPDVADKLLITGTTSEIAK